MRGLAEDIGGFDGSFRVVQSNSNSR